MEWEWKKSVLWREILRGKGVGWVLFFKVGIEVFFFWFIFEIIGFLVDGDFGVGDVGEKGCFCYWVRGVLSFLRRKFYFF